MSIKIGKTGKFDLLLDSAQLSKGLRSSKRTPRNSGYLVTCEGAVGIDGALVALDEITRMATDLITDGFPFPQIFVFINAIIVCGQTKIYEYNQGALELEYTAAEAGGVWNAVDFHDFIYMSNSKIAVVRNAESDEYELSTHPHASAICNFNGQVIIGAPDVAGLDV